VGPQDAGLPPPDLHGPADPLQGPKDLLRRGGDRGGQKGRGPVGQVEAGQGSHGLLPFHGLPASTAVDVEVYEAQQYVGAFHRSGLKGLNAL
jgi:hypothetical protein